MKPYKKIFKEDVSKKWSEIKKDFLEWLNTQDFNNCNVDYKIYGKISLDVNFTKFIFKNTFTGKLKEGDFNFIPKDSMQCTWYTDKDRGIKFFDSEFECRIIFYGV